MQNKRFWAWSGFTLASLFYLYEFCLQVSPTVMTDVLMSNYRTTAAGVGMISGFYFYAYTLMQVPVGLLYDRFSARFILGIANFICALGAICFVATDHIVLACIARFLMGMGSAFAFVAVIIFVNRWFKPIYFAALIGLAQLMSSLGAIAAETPLSLSVYYYGWKETMVAIAIFGVGLGLLTWALARDGESNHDGQPLTWQNEKQKLGRLIKDSQTLAIGLYTFFIWAPITAFAGLWGVPFIREVYHVSDLAAATYCIVIWIAIGLASPLAGIISDYYKNRRCVLMWLAVLGLLGSLLLIYAPYYSVTYLIATLTLIGVAAGGQALSFAVVNDNNANSDVGTASGINNMFTVAGGAIFQPLIGVILKCVSDGYFKNNVPVYSVTDYQIAMTIVPICFLFAILVAKYMLKESYNHDA